MSEGVGGSVGADAAAIEAQPDVAAWLQQCGSCDAGLTTSCTCPDGDPRNVIASLLALVGQLQGQLDAAQAVAKAMRRASTLTGWADRIDSAAAAVLSDREGTQ